MNARLRAVVGFALVALVPDLASAEPWPSRFLDECLAPGPTRFTPEFDAYHADSYTVNKLELVEALPAAARERGLQLRGSLIVGPQGSFWSYFVFTFLEERGWIRVNALVMPHARITAKSTALLTPRQFTALAEHLRQLSFVRAAPDSSSLRAELANQRSKQDEPDLEWQYRFLFTEFAPQQSPLLFGNFDGFFGGAERRDLAAVLEPLTAVLKLTYQHGARHPGAVRRTNWSLAGWAFIAFQHDPVPELNRELAQLGYAGFDADAHWLGFSAEAIWRRLRLGYELALTPSRVARHSSGADAQASFNRQRVSLRVGYDLLALPELRVFPLLGLRVGTAALSGGSEAAPLSRSAPSEPAGAIKLEQTVASAEVALGIDARIPLSPWLHKPWLIVGARIGGVLASWDYSWEADGRGGFSEVPGAPESSFFGMFVFGMGYDVL